MAIVDKCYYNKTFFGETIADYDFERYEARAEMLIFMMCRGRVSEDNFDALHPNVQKAVKSAICAQIEYFGIYGVEVSTTGKPSSNDFTVGKVSVRGSTDTDSSSKAGRAIAPLAYALLEQTGLLNPDVATVDQVFISPWVI